MELLEILPNSEHLKKIEKIYNYSFPENERIDFQDIVNHTFPNSKLYGIFIENSLIGFIYASLLGNIAYLIYLAIEKGKRNKGFGTQAINTICSLFKDKTKVLCVEKPEEQDSMKLRRIKFYERNGFTLANFQFNYLEQDYYTMYYGKFNKQEFIEFLNICFPGCKDFKKIKEK